MKRAYTDLAKYYDLIFQDKDYVSESKFIRDVVKKRKPNARSILDVGCGTGIHLNLLKNELKVLYGVDISPEIIREAKKKSKKARFLVGGMSDFTIKRKFDILICLFSVFNYNLTTKEAQKTLENFKRHLNLSGLAIVALYNPRNTEKRVSLHFGRGSGVEVAKINQYFVDPETHFEICDYLVLVKNRKGVDFYTETGHKYRIYETNEFTALLKKAGFVDIAVFDNVTNKPVSPETKYPVFVATLGK